MQAGLADVHPLHVAHRDQLQRVPPVDDRLPVDPAAEPVPVDHVERLVHPAQDLDGEDRRDGGLPVKRHAVRTHAHGHPADPDALVELRARVVLQAEGPPPRLRPEQEAERIDRAVRELLAERLVERPLVGHGPRRGARELVEVVDPVPRAQHAVQARGPARGAAPGAEETGGVEAVGPREQGEVVRRHPVAERADGGAVERVDRRPVGDPAVTAAEGSPCEDRQSLRRRGRIRPACRRSRTGRQPQQRPCQQRAREKPAAPPAAPRRAPPHREATQFRRSSESCGR